MALRYGPTVVSLVFLTTLFSLISCQSCTESLSHTKDAVVCRNMKQTDGGVSCEVIVYSTQYLFGFAYNLELQILKAVPPLCSNESSNITSLWYMITKTVTITKLENIASNRADFQLNSNFGTKFFTLSHIDMDLNYENAGIDGVADISPGCDPERNRTSKCQINFNWLMINIPLSNDTFKNISIKNLFLYNRRPRITYLNVIYKGCASVMTGVPQFMHDVTYVKAKFNSDHCEGVQITELMQDTKMMKLKELNFNMILKPIPNGFWEKVTNVKRLEIAIQEEQNKNYSLPEGICMLKDLNSLTLTFAVNQNLSLDLNPGSCLENLIVLRLSQLSNFFIGDNVFELSREKMPKLKNLKVLEIYKVADIPEDLFLDLPSLRYINFRSNNFIKTVHPNTFSHLHSSKLTIKLEYNQLQNISKLNLSTHGQQIIDLSVNKISNINNLIACGNIKSLDLSKNLIKNWTSPFVFSNKNLSIKNVDLSLNKINVITRVMGDSLNELNSVELGENLFDCQSCSLKDFQSWLQKSPVKILNLNSTRPFLCELPDVQKVRGDTVLGATYNSERCENTAFYVKVGVPSAALVALCGVTSLLVYVYRYELLYIRHMWRTGRLRDQADPTEGCQFDVFVSHCEADSRWVSEVLVPALEEPPEAAHKYRLCLHARDFPGGSDVLENIEEGVCRSRKVLMVLSEGFVRSGLSLWEFRRCQQRLLERGCEGPVLLELGRLERESLPLNLRLTLAARTYLEWPEDERATTAFWQRLRTALGEPLDLPSVENQDNYRQQIELQLQE